MAGHDPQTVRATCFCRQCGYALQGLPEPRCPECGRDFDPDDPTTFRPSRRRVRLSKLTRITVRLVCAILGLAALAVTVAYFVNYGLRHEACADCGAMSQVRFFRLFGVGGDYERIEGEPAISRFIQEQDDKACTHRWKCFQRKYGNYFTRESGGVRDYGFMRMRAIICFQDMATMPFLRGKAEADPGFVAELKAALETDDRNSVASFFSELVAEFDEWEQEEAD